MNELEMKLGAVLQAERQRRNLSLADLSNELKISESYIEAIECGETSVLPSALYYRLFAKSYATYLGIDYTKTVEAIREDLAPAVEPIDTTLPPEAQKQAAAAAAAGRPAPPVEVAGPQQDKRGSGILKKSLIIGSIIIVAFAIVLIGWKLLTGNGQLADEPTPAEEDLTQAVVTDSTLDSGLTTYDWSEGTSTEPDSLRLTLTAKGQSWATVVADGDTAVYQSLTPWRTYAVAAQFRLVVSIGVPGAVDVTLNGEPAYLADPQTSTVSRLEINQANRTEFRQPGGPVRPPVPIPQPGGQPDSSRDSAAGTMTGGQPGQAGNR